MLFFDGLNVLDSLEYSVQQVLLLDRVLSRDFPQRWITAELRTWRKR